MPKSKKQIALEFFLALDQSEPWKSRLSQTLAHMRSQYQKGQTERVVFQYIKELLLENELPSPESASLRDAVSAKLAGIKMDKDRFADNFKQQYSGHSLVIKVIQCVDLNSTGYDLKNSNYFEFKEGELWTAGSLPTRRIVIDNAVGLVDEIDFSSYPIMKFREIFPYFDKNQLERPITVPELSKLSEHLLSNNEKNLLIESCSQGRNFPEAIKWLEGKRIDKWQAATSREVQKNIRNAGTSRTWPDKLIGWIIVVGMTALLSWCVGFGGSKSGSSVEAGYLQRCMANGTPRSVCSDWYEEIEQSVNDRR